MTFTFAQDSSTLSFKPMSRNIKSHKIGRPLKGKAPRVVLGFSADPENAARYKAYCDSEGISFSQFVEGSLSDALDRMEQTELHPVKADKAQPQVKAIAFKAVNLMQEKEKHE